MNIKLRDAFFGIFFGLVFSCFTFSVVLDTFVGQIVSDADEVCGYTEEKVDGKTHECIGYATCSFEIRYDCPCTDPCSNCKQYNGHWNQRHFYYYHDLNFGAHEYKVDTLGQRTTNCAHCGSVASCSGTHPCPYNGQKMSGDSVQQVPYYHTFPEPSSYGWTNSGSSYTVDGASKETWEDDDYYGCTLRKYIAKTEITKQPQEQTVICSNNVAGHTHTYTRDYTVGTRTLSAERTNETKSGHTESYYVEDSNPDNHYIDTSGSDYCYKICSNRNPAHTSDSWRGTKSFGSWSGLGHNYSITDGGTKLTCSRCGHWVYYQYDVHFYANKGSGSTSVYGSTASMYDLQYGQSYTLTRNGFYRAGYDWVGWSGGYSDQATIRDLGNTTLSAQWSPKTYTISFNHGITTDTSSMSSQSVTFDRTVALKLLTFFGRDYAMYFREGVHANNLHAVSINQGTISGTLPFDFWSMSPWSGTGGNTRSNQASFVYDHVGDTTLTANWKSQTLTNYKEPTLAGWRFDGWYTQQVGGTRITSRTVDPATTSYSDTLYAHWTDLNPVLAITSSNVYSDRQTLTVKATDEGSGVKSIKITDPNGNPLKDAVYSDNRETRTESVTATDCGTYTIIVTDINGNVTTQVVDYHRTDLHGNGSTEFPLKKDVDLAHVLTCTKINGVVTDYDFKFPTVERVGFHDPSGTMTAQGRDGKDGSSDYFSLNKDEKNSGLQRYKPTGNGHDDMYAVWIGNWYTIVYHKNDTSIINKNIYNDPFSTEPTGSISNAVWYYDRENATPATVYAREGYVFKEWNKDYSAVDRTTMVLTKNHTYAKTYNLTAKHHDTITLYQIYEPIKYNIIWDTNGTDLYPSRITANSGEIRNLRFDQTTKVPSCSRDYYEFVTWQIYSGGFGTTHNVGGASNNIYNNTETDPRKISGNTTRYTPGSNIRNLTCKDGTTVVVDAIWKHEIYIPTMSLTVDMKDGKVFSAPQCPQGTSRSYYYNSDELPGVTMYTTWTLDSPKWQRITKYELRKVSGSVNNPYLTGDSPLTITEGSVSGYPYFKYKSTTPLLVSTGPTGNNNYGIVQPYVTVTDNWSDSHHAQYGKELEYANSNTYGIYGDGTTPTLTGMDVLLDDLLGIDLTEVREKNLNTVFNPKTSEIDNSSISYSGIKARSYIKIKNLDTGDEISLSRVPTTDSRSTLWSNITWQGFDLKDRNNLKNGLFTGTVAFIYYLEDNVGHIYTNTDNPDITGIFDMHAYLSSKTYNPTNMKDSYPKFIQGEAVQLTVVTSGYANGLWIRFPDSFMSNEESPMYVYWGDQSHFEEDKYSQIGADGVLYLSSSMLASVTGAETSVDGDWTVRFLFVLPLYADEGSAVQDVLEKVEVVAFKGDKDLSLVDYKNASKVQINKDMITQISGPVNIEALKRECPFYIDTWHNVLDEFGTITTILDTFR